MTEVCLEVCEQNSGHRQAANVSLGRRHLKQTKIKAEKMLQVAGGFGMAAALNKPEGSSIIHCSFICWIMFARRYLALRIRAGGADTTRSYLISLGGASSF